MAKKTDVFLLAAGEANRMFPINQIMEKSLLPIGGKPVIRHIVENLTNNPSVSKHLGKIVICCLEKFTTQFQHEFRDMPDIEFKTFEEPLGTFPTLWKSIENNKPTKWIMVHYADCFTNIDYADFISKTGENRDGVIAVTKNVKHDYSEVDLNIISDEGLADVLDFYEKPKLGNYTWSGIGLFDSEGLAFYEGRYRESDFAFDIFPQMIKQKKLVAYPYNGFWYDVGNLNSYRKVCELFNNK